MRPGGPHAVPKLIMSGRRTAHCASSVNSSMRGGSTATAATADPVEEVEHSDERRTWSRRLLIVERRNRRNRWDRRNVELTHNRELRGGEMSRRCLRRGIVETCSRPTDQVVDLRHVQVLSNPVTRVGGGVNPAMGTGAEMLNLARIFHKAYPAKVVAAVLT
jgi:hypothetical protein